MPLRAYASSGDIAAPEARLATGLPGSALARRVSHPLDGFSEFHELPHVFIPFRPALPGRTVSEFVWGTREARDAIRARSRTRAPPTTTAPRAPNTLPLTGTAGGSTGLSALAVARDGATQRDQAPEFPDRLCLAR